MKNKVSVKHGIYFSKQNSIGEHPIVIYIRSNGRRKLISTGFYIHPKYWDTTNKTLKRSHPDYFDVLNHVLETEKQLRNIINRFDNMNKRISLEELVHQYKLPHTEHKIYVYFDIVIERMFEEERIKNAYTYRIAKNVIKSFCADENLTFEDIDYHFLNDLTLFLRKRGVSDGALSNYFRTIRALYNKAIRENLIDQSVYPFKQFKVNQFKTETIPRSISKEEVHRVIEFYQENPKSKLIFAAEIFTFIYLTGGINFRDIALLKHKNIRGKRIHYVRSKTTKNYQLILQPLAQEIIFKYYTEEKDDDDFIFPFLDKTIHKTPIQQYNRSKKCLKYINRDLKLIGKVLDISIPLTTYVARHSLASNLCENGVSVKIIQNLLGHTRLETTNNYLKNFNASEIDKHIAHLL